MKVVGLLPPMSPFLQEVIRDSTAALARRVAARAEQQAIAVLEDALIAGAIRGEVAIVYVVRRDGVRTMIAELR